VEKTPQIHREMVKLKKMRTKNMLNQTSLFQSFTSGSPRRQSQYGLYSKKKETSITSIDKTQKKLNRAKEKAAVEQGLSPSPDLRRSTLSSPGEAKRGGALSLHLNKAQ